MSKSIIVDRVKVIAEMARKDVTGEELAQNEAARRAGISTSTMTTRMTGKQPLTMTEVVALSKVLDIPISDMATYFGEDAPEKKKKGGVND